MNLKQKISACIATVLPLLAVTAFLAIPGQKAQAKFISDCPTETYYAPDGSEDGGCGDGHDAGVPAGSNGYFAFCNADQFGTPGGFGPGECPSDGSAEVCCTYGID